MTEISATLVKELREKTGAGMMDCKKALLESAGDLEKSIDYLRKSGMAKAAKKAGRTTTEGKITALVSEDVAVLVETLCETDFVANNEEYQRFCASITKSVAADFSNTGDLSEAVREAKKDAIGELVAKVGENVNVRRALRWSPEGTAGSYLHMGGRIGVIVDVSGDADTEYLSNLCMHIAAFNPLYLSPETVPEDVLAKEKEIAAAQPELANKPPEILDKILVGKMRKWYEENCLIKQAWIRDDKVTVESANPKADIRRYTRWQVGEEV